jgi:hypothetical protein
MTIAAIIIQMIVITMLFSLVGLLVFNIILSHNAREQKEAEKMEDMVEKYCLRKERTGEFTQELDLPPKWNDETAERASIIGQNGNDGLHYEDNES